MAHGSTSHRPPCAGSPVPTLGPCFQHYHKSESRVPMWGNSTRVLDYHTSPDALGIEPYPRLHSTVPSCADVPDCGDGSNNFPYCDPWETSSLLACTGSGVVQVNQGHFYNCFVPVSGSYLNYAACRKIGFKAVQSQKIHHGRSGPLSETQGALTSFVQTASNEFDSAQCTCLFRGVQTADDVHYLSITGDTVWDFDGGTYFGDASHGATSNVSCTTGRYTGVNTFSCTSGSYGADDDDHLTSTATIGFALGLQTHENDTLSELQTIYCTSLAGIQGTTVFYDHLTPDGADSPGLGHTLTIYIDMGGHFGVVPSVRWTITGTSLTIELWGIPDEFPAYPDQTWAIVHTLTWNLSADRVQYSEILESSLSFTTQTADIQFGTPYTSAMVKEDLRTLLNYWDLTDDIAYPWRTDNFVTVAPIVKYNEAGPNSPTTVFACRDPDGSQHQDPNKYEFDGTVLGAPMAHGYVNYFDFKHKTWGVCDDVVNSTRAYYEKEYGATSNSSIRTGDLTDGVVPAAATCWTENIPACEVIPQAHIVQDGDFWYAQKYAEIIIDRPSYNFCRPCGIDRYAIDEIYAVCISSSVGQNLGTAITTGTGSMNSGDQVLVCGNADNDGIWTVTRTGNYSFTLATRIASGSQSTDLIGRECYTGIMGKLRFPSAPAVCGNLDIIDASNTNPVTLSLAENSWLRDGDTIGVAGVLGVTAANGTHSVKWIDPSHVALTGVSGVGAAYTSSGYILTPGAAGEYWNDHGSKGTFLTIEYVANLRDFQEAYRVIGMVAEQNTADPGCGLTTGQVPLRENQTHWGVDQAITAISPTQACLPHKACCPSIICVSPNSESFCNGITYGFGWDHISADFVYGARWQREIRQGMADPLWEGPHKPCTCNAPLIGAWTMDDGSCPEDDEYDCTFPDAHDVLYYAHYPVYEALQNMPTGSPALPNGIYIGCLTQPEINIATHPTGTICNPPITTGRNTTPYPATYETPWGLYLNSLNCACDSGRFADIYSQDGVKCEDQIIDVP